MGFIITRKHNLNNLPVLEVNDTEILVKDIQGKTVIVNDVVTVAGTLFDTGFFENLAASKQTFGSFDELKNWLLQEDTFLGESESEMLVAVAILSTALTETGKFFKIEDGEIFSKSLSTNIYSVPLLFNEAYGERGIGENLL